MFASQKVVQAVMSGGQRKALSESGCHRTLSAETFLHVRHRHTTTINHNFCDDPLSGGEEMVLRKWFATITAALILAPAAAMAKPVTIQWWHAMRSARGEVANEIIKRFNESQDQYQVVGTFKGNYDETLNAGIAAFRAKKQPHIMQVFEVGTQTMMLSGAIYPVFELMKDTGNDIDWSRYLQPILSYYMNADGNLVSMPFNSSTPVMYYNKDSKGRHNFIAFINFLIMV